MRKLTVFIKGHEKSVYFDNCIVIDKGSTLFVKTATVFWNYNNVKKDINDTIVYDGYKTIPTGFWTFNMLKDEFKKHGDIKLEKNPYNGKCTISSDKLLGLLDLGILLGFQKNVVVPVNTKGESLNRCDILNGLRFVKIHCSLVDPETNLDTNGKRSDVISTLPVVETNMKGAVSHYKDIESKVSVKNGTYNCVRFNVSTNNNEVWAGSVLLDLYIL